VKDRRIGRFAFLFVIVSGLSLFVTPVHAVRIRNFRDDPDLAKAREYDRELTSDRTQASQDLAEKHYLAYLERETESFQRARVYAQLGAIFTNAVDIEAGEKRDIDKGRAYFRKVLEEEPYRIGRCTLQARLNLVGAEPNRINKVQAQMACYKLLMSLDESTVRSRWLPVTPEEQDQGPSGREVEWMLNKIQGHKATAAYNLVSLAASRSTPNRNQGLREIIEEFPGTEAADLAQKALARLDPSVQPPVQTPPPAPLAPGLPVKRPGASRLVTEPNGLALSEKPITLSSAPRPPSQEPVPLATAKPASGRRFPWWFPALGAAALILAAGAVLLYRRSSPG
jgi:hypothetical protein